MVRGCPITAPSAGIDALVDLGMHQHEIATSAVSAAIVLRLREMEQRDTERWARSNAKAVLSRWSS